MSTTVITAVDSLKLALKDRRAEFLSDAEYERFVLGAASPESSFTLSRLRGSYWAWLGGPLCLLGPSFAEEAGADYTLCCGGPGLYSTVSLRLDGGTDERTSISLTGCRVDFARCLEELLVFIATHRAQEYTQSVHGTMVSPETARYELLRQAEIIRGVRAV